MAWYQRIANVFRQDRLRHDVDEEFAFHVQERIDELQAAGHTAAAAESQARRQFGNLPLKVEETVDMNVWRWPEDLGRDVRIGLRGLLRRPGFLTVVLLTLAVGVGGASAIAGAIHVILLKPLPYLQPDDLVAVWQRDLDTGEARQEVSPANFLDWRDRVTTLEHLVAMEPYGLDWQSSEGPIYLPTHLVYEGFFDAFGAQPLLGRTFLLDEHDRGRGDVVVLGYTLWRTRFGGATDIVGRVLTLDDRPHTVVGVMSEGFAVPSDDVVWAPKVLQGWEKESRTSNFYLVFGRLRPDTSISEAAAELDTVATQLGREYPRTNRSTRVALVPLEVQMVGRIRSALWLLFGAVGLVLAVVTASIASLQLARAVARQREFAVRSALGAGRGRVTRQLVAENAIVAMIGSGASFAVAYLALEAIRALAPPTMPRLTELRADAVVLLVATSLSALVMVATGVLPALVAARSRLHMALSGGGRAVAGAGSLARVHGVLVIFQGSASLILLVGAGLLLRSFVAILEQPVGFRTEQVAVVSVQTWDAYADGEGRATFVQEVSARLAAVPGIRAAGVASSVPLMETIGAEFSPVTIENGPPLPSGEGPPLVRVTVTGGDPFAALAIPLRAGRLPDTRDDATAVPVAVVNEAFVRRFLPDGDPLTRRIVLGRSLGGGQGPMACEIIGVVGDVRRSALHEAPQPGVYVPHAQHPTGANALIVWGDAAPTALLEHMRRVVWEINPALPIYLETTMDELVGASVRARQFVLVLVGGLASLALALAAAGVFGLVSFATAQRTREFGVRLALGADRHAVVAMVLRRGLGLAALGIVGGWLGSLLLTRWLSAMLFDVSPLDPVTFIVAGGLLGISALAASLHPAWRAGTTDPTRALREQ